MRHNRLEIRKNVFSQRIVQDWNLLSAMTVAAITLNIFKSGLDKQWQAIRYVTPEAERAEYQTGSALYSVFWYPGIMSIRLKSNLINCVN